MNNTLDIVPFDVHTMYQSPDPPIDGLLRHEFTLNVTSPKGSGKTTLVLNLIAKYKGYFHKIYVISPTVANDEKWQQIMNVPDLLAQNQELEEFLFENQPHLLNLRESALQEKSESDQHKDQFILDFVNQHYRANESLPKHSQDHVRGDPSKIIVSGRGKKTPRGYLTEAGAFLNSHPGSAVMTFPQESRFLPFSAFEPSTDQVEDIFLDDHKKYFSTLFAPKPIMMQENEPFSQMKEEETHKQEDVKGYRSKLTGIQWQSPQFEMNESCVATSCSPKQLQKLLDTQNAIIQCCTHLGKPKTLADRILFIFDDMVGSDLLSRKKDSAAFKTLNVRHRHYLASIIYCSQAYNEIIRTARVNQSALIAFEIGSDKELEVMYRENQCGLNMKQWMSIYKSVVKEPYQFLMINYQNPPSKRMTKGLGEVIQIEHLREENEPNVFKDHPPTSEEECVV